MRRVVLVVYEGAQILDVSGPAAVFTSANRCSGERHYDVEIVSTSGEPVVTSGAITVLTKPLSAVAAGAVDTLLVVGGDDTGVIGAVNDVALRRWLSRSAPRARRYGSVCSGTFVLAASGLADGRRVATHWDGCKLLAEMFPRVNVDSDSLYVVDGPVWTSAGVTTGIDMALAMVEEDAGAALAAAVAQRLVVYARRPGHQSQFSALLRAQVRRDAPYATLVEWMHGNLEADLGVESLAKRAGNRRGTFTGSSRASWARRRRASSRTCASTSARPARARLRAEGDRGQTGFGSAVRMSRAFERRFGVKPSLFRELVPDRG